MFLQWVASSMGFCLSGSPPWFRYSIVIVVTFMLCKNKPSHWARTALILASCNNDTERAQKYLEFLNDMQRSKYAEHADTLKLSSFLRYKTTCHQVLPSNAFSVLELSFGLKTKPLVRQSLSNANVSGR